MTNRLGILRPCVECGGRPHWLKGAHTRPDQRGVTRYHLILGGGVVFLMVGAVLFMTPHPSATYFGDIILAVGLAVSVWGWRGSQRAARRERQKALRG